MALSHTCSWLPVCISSLDFSLNSSFHCQTASIVYPMGTSNSWPVQNKTCQSPSISVKNLAFFHLVSKVCGLVTEGLMEICHLWFLFSHTPHPMQRHIMLAQIFKTIFRIWPILTNSITPTLAPKGPVSLIPLYFLISFLSSVLTPFQRPTSSSKYDLLKICQIMSSCTQNPPVTYHHTQNAG